MDIGISDDYAVLHGDNYSFYYGYEYTNDRDEWLFIGEFKETERKYTALDLGCDQLSNPEVVLLKGIGRFLDDVDL